MTAIERDREAEQRRFVVYIERRVVIQCWRVYVNLTGPRGRRANVTEIRAYYIARTLRDVFTRVSTGNFRAGTIGTRDVLFINVVVKATIYARQQWAGTIRRRRAQVLDGAA